MLQRATIAADPVVRVQAVLWRFAHRATGGDREVAERALTETLDELRDQKRPQGRSGAVGLLARRIGNMYRTELAAGLRTPGDEGGAYRRTRGNGVGRDAEADGGPRRTVEHALGVLPVCERLVVMLCDVEQMSRKSAGRWLELSQPVVSELLSRGRFGIVRALEAREAGLTLGNR